MTLGTLHYGAEANSIEFSDDLLAHLQVLISAKLRRSEGFMLTWTATSAGKTQRVCIWIHAAIPLSFHFSHPQRRALNQELLQELAISAASSAGLDLCTLMMQGGTGRVEAPRSVREPGRSTRQKVRQAS